MLEAGHKIRTIVRSAILLGAAVTLVSCASDKPALVYDPDAKHESMVPWNKQESWETGGQFAGMTDRR
jgi:hypothetical protein